MTEINFLKYFELDFFMNWLAPKEIFQKASSPDCWKMLFGVMLFLPFPWIFRFPYNFFICFIFAYRKNNPVNDFELTKLAITCSKLTIETLEQGVKYVQS